MEKARTRIAPSPTGYMHIGTLRTALFNYFLAKQTGGEFLIRIEDTDRERLVEGAVEDLLKTFKHLNLSYDEGPVLTEEGFSFVGDHGPYVQSERLSIYREHVEKLISQGDAYHCFCSTERLQKMREEQKVLKQTPKYDRLCAGLAQEEVTRRLEAGELFVVRMKIPEGETTINDAIRGTVMIQNKEVDDQVILKSDGFPTYHLAVVVDDHSMNITHVIRGEEWLPSTPKHVILYGMFGYPAPVFAHVPLLLNPDKTKLSKRQGDVAVEDYLKRGYLPEALLNFVGTLGFNPTGDREIYTIEELIEMFRLEKVNKSGAVLNIEKLDWMNNQYIRTIELDQLMERAASFVQADTASDRVRRAVQVERERINRLDELQEKIDMYIEEPAYDPHMLVWKKADEADAIKQLNGLQELLSSVDDWESVEVIEGSVKAYIESNELQNGNVLWPLRVSLSGKERSASPFELLWALQKEESLKRIEKGINLLS